MPFVSPSPFFGFLNLYYFETPNTQRPIQLNCFRQGRVRIPCPTHALVPLACIATRDISPPPPPTPLQPALLGQPVSQQSDSQQGVSELPRHTTYTQAGATK